MKLTSIEDLRREFRRKNVFFHSSTGDKKQMIASPEEFEAMQDPAGDTPAETAPKKRRGGRRKQVASPVPTNGSGRQTSTKSNTVTLNAGQMTTLWAIATGGGLIIDDTGDAPLFHVSMDSIQTVLPKLIEKL